MSLKIYMHLYRIFQVYFRFVRLQDRNVSENLKLFTLGVITIQEIFLKRFKRIILGYIMKEEIFCDK